MYTLVRNFSNTINRFKTIQNYSKPFKKIKSKLETELSKLEMSLSIRYSCLDENRNSDSINKIIKTNLTMKNQIENLKMKNSDLSKINSDLKREIEFISKCKNCSKSESNERQLFRKVIIPTKVFLPSLPILERIRVIGIGMTSMAIPTPFFGSIMTRIEYELLTYFENRYQLWSLFLYQMCYQVIR